MIWPKGKPKSAEQKQKLSLAQRGRTFSEEHKAKIGAATKRRWDAADPALIAAREAGTLSRTSPVGTRSEHADGYWLLKTEIGWMLEHRYVMSVKLGRPLTDEEDVHHKDEDKKNNDPDNLEIMTPGEHSRLHRLLENGRNT